MRKKRIDSGTNNTFDSLRSSQKTESLDTERVKHGLWRKWWLWFHVPVPTSHEEKDNMQRILWELNYCEGRYIERGRWRNVEITTPWTRIRIRKMARGVEERQVTSRAKGERRRRKRCVLRKRGHGWSGRSRTGPEIRVANGNTPQTRPKKVPWLQSSRPRPPVCDSEGGRKGKGAARENTPSPPTEFP